MNRKLRIGILLFILVSVAHTAWVARGRTTEWKNSVRVAIYPIAGDASATTAAYVQQLREAAFLPIAAFMKSEAARYRLAQDEPVEIYLAPVVAASPPIPPFGGSQLEVIAWSLRFRFWAWRNDTSKRITPDVRLFVRFHDPAQSPRLPHSTGLRKGLLGIVNAFAHAGYEGSNNVVIAHELLHTLGATDKYDFGTNQPRYPEGYAEPYRVPRLPQARAEIMAGRRPISDTQADIPVDLAACVIGAATAREINWVR